MKKILFFLILLFIPLSFTFAEECNYLFDSLGSNFVVNGRFTTYIYSSLDSTNIFTYSPDTTKSYTLFAVNSSNQQVPLCLSPIAGVTFLNLAGGSCSNSLLSATVTPTQNNSVNLIRFQQNTEPSLADLSSILSNRYLVVEGSQVCLPTTPEPPTPPSDNVYSTFLTLYLDRFSYLATGFTSNPYLLSMISIIFAWIVLELFLHIYHMKGGYRK